MTTMKLSDVRKLDCPGAEQGSWRQRMARKVYGAPGVENDTGSTYHLASAVLTLDYLAQFDSDITKRAPRVSSNRSATAQGDAAESA